MAAKKRHKENPQIRQPLSDPIKLKISTALRGITRSPETIERIRKANLGRTPWNIGVTHSSSTRKKISTRLSGRKLTQEHKNNIRIGRIKYMQTNPGATVSKTEIAFLNSIENLYGIIIERGFVISNKVFDGRYKNILIESDGSYWHSSQKSIQNDSQKNMLAEKSRYTLLRFNIDSIKQIDKVLSDNKGVLDRHFHSPS